MKIKRITINANSLEAAEICGKVAFHAGIKCAPILDTVFCELEHWACAEMMAAWFTGWHTANLANEPQRTIWNSDGTDGPVLICTP